MPAEAHRKVENVVPAAVSDLKGTEVKLSQWMKLHSFCYELVMGKLWWVKLEWQPVVGPRSR